MAGPYEFWRDKRVTDPDDTNAWLALPPCSPRRPSPDSRSYPDRQPLILERTDWERWLAPEVTDVEEIADLFDVCRTGGFEAYPVSRDVVLIRNNGPHLIDPAPESELVGVGRPDDGEIIG